jgi:hypothetical protein
MVFPILRGRIGIRNSLRCQELVGILHLPRERKHTALAVSCHPILEVRRLHPGKDPRAFWGPFHDFLCREPTIRRRLFCGYTQKQGSHEEQHQKPR